MSENGSAQGSERFVILAQIIEYAKKDVITTITPCGLRLMACTEEGPKEIEGFEELELRDKMFVISSVLKMQEDVFNKYREVTMKAHAVIGRASGPGGLVEASSVERQNLLGK